MPQIRVIIACVITVVFYLSVTIFIIKDLGSPFSEIG